MTCSISTLGGASASGHPPRVPRRLAAAGTLLLCSLAACGQTPAAPPATTATAPACATAPPASSLPMPSGVDSERLRLMENAKPVKVYVEALRFGDGPEDKALFPKHMAELAEFSKGGLTRLLADTILTARRFEVYDLGASVTAEQSPLIIDSRILEATQGWQNLEGGRKRAQVRVTMSVQLRNSYTGQNLFPTAVLVEGRTGMASNDGLVIGPMDDVNAPAAQRQLAMDYHTALKRAFREATWRVSDIIRPMGRVMSAQQCDVGLFGGITFGMQGGDELIIFRATTAKLGQREVLASTLPVAKVRCDGVGTENAQCRLVAVVAGQQPQVGDYAVVTDEAMRRTRKE